MGILHFYFRPYEMHEKLGEGQNSCVFRATRKDFDSGMTQTVALKVLKSKTLIQLWRTEFENLVKIRSPHCVALYSWERIGGSPALALEFIEGVTLRQLSERVDVDDDMFSEIRRQAGLGLKELEERKLYHGDLNLNNIMINTDGVVKLIDFGVHFDRGLDRTTVEFAHPVILSGERPNLTTDQYSLDRVLQYAANINNKHFPSTNRVAEPIAETLADLVKRAKNLTLNDPVTQVLERETHLAEDLNPGPFFMTLAGLVLLLMGIALVKRNRMDVAEQIKPVLLEQPQTDSMSVFIRTDKWVKNDGSPGVENVGFNRFVLANPTATFFIVKIGQKTFRVPTEPNVRHQIVNEKDLIPIGGSRKQSNHN
jgi:serine/threonine protein kinase